MNHRTAHGTCSALFAGLLLPLTALAEPDAADARGLSLEAIGDPVPVAELADASGREGISSVQLSELQETATLTGNTVHSSTNGANVVGAGAFSGADGFTSSIQNSGNNVIIQEAVIYNISVFP